MEDHFHICAAEEDIDDMDIADDGDRPDPTLADIRLWLGSDPAVTTADPDAPDPNQPTLFEQLSPSQKEFAVVALGGAQGLYYLSGRAGFGKSHLARFLVHAFRSMGQLVAVTGTTATAASNIGGVTVHRFLKLSKGFESSLDPSHAMWPTLKSIGVVWWRQLSPIFGSF